jgi:hypothetical protein
MFTVALLTLFLSPVGSPVTPPQVMNPRNQLISHSITALLLPSHSPLLQGYDQTIIPMTVVMVSICLGIVVAGMGMLFLQVFPAFYARPLRYDVDVLEQ